MKGDFSKLSKMAKTLRAMGSVEQVQAIAKRAAPDLTARTKSAFSSGRTVYGDARPLGTSGNELTLSRSGALETFLRFRAVGTLVRAVLAIPYAKYQIRYGILPNGGRPIPTAWQESIRAHARAELQQRLAA